MAAAVPTEVQHQQHAAEEGKAASDESLGWAVPRTAPKKPTYPRTATVHSYVATMIIASWIPTIVINECRKTVNIEPIHVMFKA
jgi:hypothetical protein